MHTVTKDVDFGAETFDLVIPGKVKNIAQVHIKTVNNNGEVLYEGNKFVEAYTKQWDVMLVLWATLTILLIVLIFFGIVKLTKNRSVAAIMIILSFATVSTVFASYTNTVTNVSASDWAVPRAAPYMVTTGSVTYITDGIKLRFNKDIRSEIYRSNEDVKLVYRATYGTSAVATTTLSLGFSTVSTADAIAKKALADTYSTSSDAYRSGNQTIYTNFYGFFNFYAVTLPYTQVNLGQLQPNAGNNVYIHHKITSTAPDFKKVMVTSNAMEDYKIPIQVIAPDTETRRTACTCEGRDMVCRQVENQAGTDPTTTVTPGLPTVTNGRLIIGNGRHFDMNGDYDWKRKDPGSPACPAGYHKVPATNNQVIANNYPNLCPSWAIVNPYYSRSDNGNGACAVRRNTAVVNNYPGYAATKCGGGNDDCAFAMCEANAGTVITTSTTTTSGTVATSSMVEISRVSNSPSCSLRSSCTISSTELSNTFTVRPINGVGQIRYARSGGTTVTQPNTVPYVYTAPKIPGKQTISVSLTDLYDSQLTTQTCMIDNDATSTPEVVATGTPVIVMGKSPAVTLNRGGNCTISWDIKDLSASSSCILSGGSFSGSISGKGSRVFGPLTENTRYTITCSGGPITTPITASTICRVNQSVIEN